MRLRFDRYAADCIVNTPSLQVSKFTLRKPSETVREAAFEAYQSFVPPQPVAAVREALTAAEGATISERTKASVTVLESQAVRGPEANGERRRRPVPVPRW